MGKSKTAIPRKQQDGWGRISQLLSMRCICWARDIGLFSPLLPPCTRVVTGFVTGLFSLHSPATFFCLSCFFPFLPLSVGSHPLLSHTSVSLWCVLFQPLSHIAAMSPSWHSSALKDLNGSPLPQGGPA